MNLDILNKQQRLAVETTEGPLLVLAGAGSGKTRVLTHRIAYLIEQKNVAPWSILALTFTNKAAAEMRERVDRLVSHGAAQVKLATFHSFCARLLSVEIEKLGYDPAFVIYDDYDQQVLIGHIIKDLNLNDKIYSKRMLSSVFSEAKNCSRNPENWLFESGKSMQVRQAFKLYQQRLKQFNALDFDDLLLKTIELFVKFPEVLESYRSRYQYILVDEYQDTNIAQYDIVAMLAKNHRNLCVVGDDDQSIYGWRGADIRNILEFEKDFPGAVVIRLEQNYRSTDKILAAANCVISNNASRKSKTLWTERSNGEEISVYQATDERDEAAYICNRIINGIRTGKSYNDFAVLYRTHAQSRIIEMMLQSYSIPYKVYGGVSFFARAEIKDILCYLRLFQNPADDEAFLRIVNVPRRKIGEATIAELAANAKGRGLPLMSAAMDPAGLAPSVQKKLTPFCDMVMELYLKYGTISLLDFTELLLDRIDYLGYLAEDKKETFESRKEAVMELLGYIKDFEKDYTETDGNVLQAFLNNIALFSAAEAVDEKNGCVNLMTLHSAKGLEFPTVFLCGLEDGLFPSMRSTDDPQKLEEERRLCYVGITRAMDKLHISYASTRTLYGQTTAAMPSMFLTEMAKVVDVPFMRQRQQRSADSHSSRESYSSYNKNSAPAAQYKPYVPPAPKNANSLDVNIGDRVSHKVFGNGTVSAIAGSGSTKLVEISFDKGAVKKFAAAYAPITKL